MLSFLNSTLTQGFKAKPESSEKLGLLPMKYDRAESKSFLNWSSEAFVGLNWTLPFSKSYSSFINLVVTDTDSSRLFLVFPISTIPTR